MSHVHDDLTALLDGELPPARAEEVRRHLAACEGCRAEEARLRAGLRALAALPAAPEPSPFLLTRLEARLAAGPAARAGLLSRLGALPWRLAVPGAALAAGALAAALSVRAVHRRDEAIARHLELLLDYEAVASLGDVDTPEDAQVVAHLDDLAGKEARP